MIPTLLAERGKMQLHKMRCPTCPSHGPNVTGAWYGMEPIIGLQSRRISVPIHMVQPSTAPAAQSRPFDLQSCMNKMEASKLLC